MVKDIRKVIEALRRFIIPAAFTLFAFFMILLFDNRLYMTDPYTSRGTVTWPFIRHLFYLSILEAVFSQGLYHFLCGFHALQRKWEWRLFACVVFLNLLRNVYSFLGHCSSLVGIFIYGIPHFAMFAAGIGGAIFWNWALEKALRHIHTQGKNALPEHA